MSVPEQIPESNYVGNGTTTTFAANFDYASDSDVYVTVNGIAPEIGQATFANGVFTFATAPASGALVRVYRSTPIERDTEYDNHDNVFQPNVVNIDFDRIWFVLQEHLLSLGITNQRITKEISDRIQADLDLTFDYIQRDESLKQYVDQTIGALTDAPDFSGILASYVKDASGKSQQTINNENSLAISQKAPISLVDDVAQKAPISLVAEVNDKAPLSIVDTVNLKANQSYVDTALAGFQNGAIKTYPTLAAANADIANIAINTKVSVLSATDGGDYYKANASATSLTKSPWDAIAQAKAYTNNINSITNRLRSSLVNFDEFPISTNQYVTFQKIGSSLKIYCAPNTGVIQSEWRADASDFKTGKFSAQIKLSADVGSGGTVLVKQYDLSNTLLGTTNIATALSGVINNQTYSVSDVALVAGAKFVGIELNLSDSTNKVRTATISEIILSDGAYIGTLPLIQNFLPKINVFPSPSLSKSKATLFNASSSDGVLTLEGSAQQEATFDLNVNDLVKVGSYLAFSASVFTDTVGKVDLSLQCFNSSNTQINTNIVIANTQINTWEKVETRLIVPANTAYVRFRFVKRTGTSLAQIRSVIATSSDAYKALTLNAFPDFSSGGGSYNIIYMSKTGSDLNDGKAKSRAVASMAKAISLASPRGQIIVAEGDYEYTSDGFTWAGVSELNIEAERNARVRFITNNKLSGITKTAGYTKVYQAPLLSSGWNPPRGNWIWHHDSPDPRSLISPSERLALQRGQTHRLLSTKIEKVNSIAEIESATVPKWYHDTTNNTIYFSIWGGDDATTADIRIPSSRYSPFYGGTGTEKIRMIGIDALYAGNNGISAQRLISVEIQNCRCMFNKDNGAAYDDSKFIIARYNEYAGNEWDGGNVHCYQSNNYQMPVVYQAFDIWSHDNGDDGDSMHEICLGTYWGGLYEYNGDRGIATAYGAHATAYSTHARYNGKIDPVGGEGFAALGQLSTDTGVGTQMDCYNCISIGNRYNYMATLSSSTVNAYNCTSRDAFGVGYFGDSGTVNAYDCKTTGDAVVKSGIVNIKNSDILS